MPKEQFFKYITTRKVTFNDMNDEDVRFVLDQYCELDFYSASSLRQ